MRASSVRSRSSGREELLLAPDLQGHASFEIGRENLGLNAFSSRELDLDLTLDGI